MCAHVCVYVFLSSEGRESWDPVPAGLEAPGELTYPFLPSSTGNKAAREG